MPKHCFSKQMRATEKARKNHEKVTSKNVTSNKKSSEKSAGNLGACAMTTQFLDNKNRTFKILLLWRLPRKTAFLDNFPLCPQGPPPQKRKFYFYCRLANRRLGSITLGPSPLARPYLRYANGTAADSALERLRLNIMADSMSPGGGTAAAAAVPVGPLDHGVVPL